MSRKPVSSLALAERVFSKAAEGRKLAEKRKRQQQKQQERAMSAFNFSALPFDIKEMILQYLPAAEIGMCCAVARSWGHLYQGAVASIFAQVVGVARGRSRLTRRAELQLVHRLRNTHEKATAIETALWAAFNGYTEYVLRLIEDPNTEVFVNSSGKEDWDSATLLHVACRQGNLKLVKSLLELDANPACLTKSKQTPLILASDYGYAGIVEYLLERCGRSLNLNWQDGAGRSALFAACDRGNLDVVIKLVDWAEMEQQESGDAEAVLDVNLGTLERGSPLCTACRTGQTGIVNRLLDAQVDVNCATEDGRTALYCAVERGAIRTTKLLLAKRPVITESEMAKLLYEENPHHGMEQAITRAETEREIPNVAAHGAGVLIDYAANTGKTPVFVAAERGNSDLLQVLMDQNANTNKPTFLQKTPLYAATENGHKEVVKMLLTQCTREDVLHQTNFGTTAPFMAQRNGHMAIKALLTEFCAAKMTTEKAKRRKSKRKQSDAMNRLYSKEKAGKRAASPAPFKPSAFDVDNDDNNTSFATDGLKEGRDVSNSKRVVNELVQNLLALEIAVDAECTLQREGRGTSASTRATSAGTLGSVENNLDCGNATEKCAEEVEMACEKSTHQSDFESKVEIQEDKAEQEEEQDQQPATDEDDEHGSTQDAAKSEAESKPGATDLRAVRAAYFESKLEETPQSNTGRLVPRKEKDVQAAREWSKSFEKTYNEDQREEAHISPRSSCGPTSSRRLELCTIRNSLLEFSSLTSDYKMDEATFKKVFGENARHADKVFQSMRGSKPVANAWDVFVASTLCSSGSIDDKFAFCFGLFDSTSKGVLEHKVARTMLRCCCKAIKRIYPQSDAKESKEYLQSVVDSLPAPTQSLSRETFCHWATCSKMGMKLFGPILSFN